MLHFDRRLAVQEHAAVAVDDERGDVALAFFANALADAAQADDRFDDADVRAVVDDRNGDDDRRLVRRRDVLERAGVDLPFERGLQREVELLRHRRIQLRRLRLGAFPVAIENAQRRGGRCRE